MERFFQSPRFAAFLAQIKAAPTSVSAFSFAYNGALSKLTFSPGQPTGGGGHIVHTLPFDPHKNPIISRLRAKDDQIARAKLELPAVVVLCDADCNSLHSRMPSFGAQSAAQIIHTFLNIRRQSRRINGVSLWPVFCEFGPMNQRPPRYYTTPQTIANNASTYQSLDENTLADVSAASIHLPPMAQAPHNARRKSKWPRHYGGYSVRGSNPMQIRMSLLSLQYLLSGSLPADKFVQGNASLMNQFKIATDRGFIITAARVARCENEDDDWIELELTQEAPSHLLACEPVRK
jgi:hypothetical protein